MGNLTTAYADSSERLFVITRGLISSNDVISYHENGSTYWKKNPWFEKHELKSSNFDKSFDDLMKAFEYGGFRLVSTKLQTGKIVTSRNDEMNFREGWLITPSVVKSIAKSLQKCSLEFLVSKWNAARTKELESSGLDIGSFDVLMLPNIENLKDFFNQSATKNDYLLFLQ